MICTLLLSFTALATPALPQDPPTGLTRDQLELTTYTPTWISADELYQVAHEMFGRGIRIEDRLIQNLNLLYDSILIYDLPSECARIVSTLTRLEKRYEDANALTESAQELPLLRDVPLLDFRLRAMGAGAAMQALQPHLRDVSARDEEGGFLSFPNVQLMDDALLLLRDSKENLESMRSLIEKLDQPPPQVAVSAWVLRGGEVETPSALPAELGKNLAALLPGMNFEIESRGMLQSSAEPGLQIQLRMRGGFETRYELNLITGPYDAKNGRMTLQSCEFFVAPEGGESELLFETSTVLRTGEYAVIGLTGAEPVLLVLRFAPL